MKRKKDLTFAEPVAKRRLITESMVKIFIIGTILNKAIDDNVVDGYFECFEWITQIEDWAFHKCTNLTHLNLPEGVIQIGKNAFSGCSKLNHINLPMNIKKFIMERFRVAQI